MVLNDINFSMQLLINGAPDKLVILAVYDTIFPGATLCPFLAFFSDAHTIF